MGSINIVVDKFMVNIIYVLTEISRITGRSTVLGYTRTRQDAEMIVKNMERLDDRYIIIIKEVANLG